VDAVKGNLAGGVAGSPSDPENKQFLDARTNTQSKSNFVSNAPRNERPNVSIADAPQEAADRILTGRLSEVDEVRALADDATANTRPGLRTNSALRARMSADPAVRNAQQSNGVNPDTFTLENPPGVSQFPNSSSVNLSPVDADINPATGEVVPGPNTSAAQARRAAAATAPPADPPAAPPANTDAQAIITNETTNDAKAALGADVNAEANALTHGEAGLLTRLGGAEGVAVKGLWVLNAYFAWNSYEEGTRPNTPAPVGSGMIGGSEGEGILNAAGTLAGGLPAGTMLRQAAEFGSTGSDLGKVWNAIKSGTASPTSIGMGIIFGAFR
jgi:hypothetical protein